MINPYENQLLLFGYNCTIAFYIPILQTRCHKMMTACHLTILLVEFNKIKNPPDDRRAL